MGKVSLLDRNVPKIESEMSRSILNLSDGIVSFTKKDSFTSFISPGFNNPISARPFFIKNGRAEIGLLNPGEMKEVKLSFFVKETIPSDKFNMDLLISDSIFGTFLSNKLTFPIVAGKNKLTQASSTLKISRNNIPLYSGMSFNATVVSMMKEGAIIISDV